MRNEARKVQRIADRVREAATNYLHREMRRESTAELEDHLQTVLRELAAAQDELEAAMDNEES